MDSCNFTNKANSPTPKVEIHTRQKLCHFGRYVAKAKLFRRKSCVPVTRTGVFIWLFIWQPGFSHEHIEIFTKEGEARRDLGNRASLVDRAHMKRPLKLKDTLHCLQVKCKQWHKPKLPSYTTWVFFGFHVNVCNPTAALYCIKETISYIHQFW